MGKILDMAEKLAWPKGTKKKKYSYKGGRPTKAFKAAFKKVWGNTSKEKMANCDRAMATVIRYSKVEPKMPSGNAEQIKYKPKRMKRKAYKNCRPSKVTKEGDAVVIRKSNGKRHSFFRGKNASDGKPVIYEAQRHKAFLHRSKNPKKFHRRYPRVVIFRER